MRTWLWLLLVIGCLPSAGLADVTLNGFAYGIRLNVPAGTAVAAASLPRQVYESATRSDLGDMRVFNAAGEPVPPIPAGRATLAGTGLLSAGRVLC
jgi:hypothetical protein